MPLCFSNVGTNLRVSAILGNSRFVKRINSMGLVEGDSIKILSVLHGSYIILVKNVKLALSFEAASKIHVEC